MNSGQLTSGNIKVNEIVMARIADIVITAIKSTLFLELPHFGFCSLKNAIVLPASRFARNTSQALRPN
jgi:hypothetical protein